MPETPADRPVLFLSYERLDHWIASLQPELLAADFAAIVGILRGGAPLALMASHAIGVPVAFLRYDRASAAATWDSSLPVPPAGSRVLLCEDLAGRGRTLTDCVALLEARGLRVTVLTGAFDELSRRQPDYGLDARGRTVSFPWERHAYTRGYRADWERTGAGASGPLRPDHEYEVYGIDLDGILLPDIPSAVYEADVLAALDARDRLAPYEVLPHFEASATVIITGRPESDRGRTERWLAAQGFGIMRIIMRAPEVHPHGPDGAAAHKAGAALAAGCTIFIESEAAQAIAISRHAPLLRVVWWDASTRTGTLIDARDWRRAGGDLG